MNNIPPHSIEAEQGILGSLMLFDSDSPKAKEAIDLLIPDAFYNRSHRIIFQAILKTDTRDFISISEILNQSGELEDAGGFAYLGEITKSVPSTENILNYVNVVNERYQLRKLLGFLYTATEQAYHKTESVEIVEQLSNSIANIECDSAYEPLHIASLADGWVDRMEKRIQNDSDEIGFPTGFKDFDDVLGGIGQEWLTVIAGRPSMGKTKIAQMISNGVSWRDAAMTFSMEMSDEETADRTVGLAAGVKPKNLRMGELSDYEWSRVNKVLGGMVGGNFNMYLDTTSGLSANQVRQRVKATKKYAEKKGKNLKCFIVDYLELMTLEKADRYDLQMAETIKKLKEIARDLKVACILLVQANRGADDAKRPSMSHLYGSSAIEKYADFGFFVHREDVGDPDTVYRGITFLIPFKSRHTDMPRDVLLAQKRDEDGGQFYCLDASEKGSLEHQNDLKNEPKRYSSR